MINNKGYKIAKVIILTGAGVSAESGITTFRDKNGLWEQHNIQEICSANSLYANYSKTIDFYDDRRVELKDKKPNKTHIAIAKIKNKYPNDIVVITQNIDDLFEKAKCKDVIHLHGKLKEIRCMSCDFILNVGYDYQDDMFDCCPKCSGKFRPNIVFFGEEAPLYVKLDNHIQDCEFLVVIGTSGKVIGVNAMASFVDYSILNNLEPSDAIDDSVFSKVYYQKSTEVIDEIINEIDSFF